MWCGKRCLTLLIALCFPADIFASSDGNEVGCVAPWLGSGNGVEVIERRSFYQQFEREVRVAETQLSRLHECIMPFEKIAGIQPRVLVDVRRTQDFSSYSIPSSINMDANAISTREFLKKQALVLIDYSYRFDALTYLCENLKFDGFQSVYIVKGGISAWLGDQNKGNNQRLPQRLGLTSISAKDFLVAPRKNRWIIVDLTVMDVPESKYVIKLNTDESDQVIEGIVSAKVKSFIKEGGDQPNLLLVDMAGENDDRWRAVIPSGLQPYAYVLQGGMQAYESYVDSHVAMLKQKQRMSQRNTSGCG